MTQRTQEQALKYALSMVGYGYDFDGHGVGNVLILSIIIGITYMVTV